MGRAQSMGKFARIPALISLRSKRYETCIFPPRVKPAARSFAEQIPVISTGCFRLEAAGIRIAAQRCTTLWRPCLCLVRAQSGTKADVYAENARR